MHISKALLKNEIDELDEDYLELVYNILRQFPHRLMDAERRKETAPTSPISAPDEPQQVATGREALAILRRNGFIGCLHGNGHLSQDYKQELDWNHKL